MLYPVILSGGVGKRLWPVSSQKSPKQFQKFFNNKTLLQNTYQRILTGFDKKQVFVVSNRHSLNSIKSQISIKKSNIILEPEAKGTAMAIGLAALRLSKLDSEAKLVIINSDNFIKDTKKYIQLLKKAEKILGAKYQDKFLLAGIKPTYPETGYGYIKLGKKVANDLFLVDSFKEKPTLATAKKYIKEGFLWNPAIFLFSAKNLLSWYSKFLPDIYKALMSIAEDESLKNLKKQYSKIQNISIDYGLLEKMKEMLLIRTDLNWLDIGNWRSLRDICMDSKNFNVSNTKNVSLASKNNLFYSSKNKLIATIGVEDMILVETDKTILLCPVDRAQDIKKLLTSIKQKKLDKHL